MEPKTKVGSSTTFQKSEASEVSGDSVRRITKTSYYNDGSSHTTESIITNGTSTRMSWDTDVEGKDSDFHVNKNG